MVHPERNLEDRTGKNEQNKMKVKNKRRIGKQMIREKGK